MTVSGILLMCDSPDRFAHGPTGRRLTPGSPMNLTVVHLWSGLVDGPWLWDSGRPEQKNDSRLTARHYWWITRASCFLGPGWPMADEWKGDISQVLPAVTNDFLFHVLSDECGESWEEICCNRDLADCGELSDQVLACVCRPIECRHRPALGLGRHTGFCESSLSFLAVANRRLTEGDESRVHLWSSARARDTGDYRIWKLSTRSRPQLSASLFTYEFPLMRCRV